MATNYTYDAYETEIARVDLNSDGSAKFWNGFSGRQIQKRYRSFRWTAAENGWDANTFTITETGSATQTLSDVDDGGAVILLNAGADNDKTVVRQGKGTDGTGGLYITHKPNKKIYIEGVFKLNAATEIDWYFGVFNKSTDPVGTIPTSGFFFRKDDGDTQIDCVTVGAGTSTTTTSTNIATQDTNYHTFGIKVYGGTKVEYYIDDVIVATHTNTSNLPASTVFMAPHLCVQNGDAVTPTQMNLKEWSVSSEL